MPPKKATAAAGEDAGSENGKPAAYTDGEMKLFSAMMGNLNTLPDCNWDKIAQEAGLKDAKVAKERFRQVRVKFGWNYTAGGATPASSGRKRASTASAAVGEGAAAGPITPTKVTKARGRAGSKKTPVKAVDSDNEDNQNGDEATPTTPGSGATGKPTPKKRGRKPKNATVATASAVPAITPPTEDGGNGESATMNAGSADTGEAAADDGSDAQTEVVMVDGGEI